MTAWPAPLKELLRPVPQWAAVALRAPQELIRVRLSGPAGECDVTRNNVVAALRPLTVAVGLERALAPALESAALALQFIDASDGRMLGVLRLDGRRDWCTERAGMALFGVASGAHACLRWPHRPWNRWLQDRAARRHDKPGNFALSADATQQIMIFYICPRPVVLVSVQYGSHGNIFPMDLIGPIGADRFTLALRSTSISVEPMKSARRVALSDVAATEHRIAYGLGAHHKAAQVDWDDLPFRMARSPLFELPVPECALRIRELEILDFETVGSHTLFMTRIATDQVRRDEAQFFHTSGIHQWFRTRQGRALPAAP